MGVEKADQALRACHAGVFKELLSNSVSEYVLQIEEYIRYTRTDRQTLLTSWQSLEAYRAAVPIPTLAIYRELFFLNVETALAILVDEVHVF